MQTPLSVYLLIDKKNRQATEIFNRFYTLLCRDVENPLSDGLDIPVYLISNDENGEMKEIFLMKYDYTGKKIKPKVTVKYKGKKLPKKNPDDVLVEKNVKGMTITYHWDI